MQPRPYQQRAIKQIVEYACEHIDGRLLVVLPPGGGKTLIMAEVLRLMAAEQGMYGLAWAHRRELVGQMRDHLVECGVPESMVGVVMADDARANPDSLIQVASVDTLRHRDKPIADIVVSDEAHRDASDGRRKLRAEYPRALHVGFTASPIRLDGRGLRSEYDDMIVVAQPSELIADGWLAAPTIYTVPLELLPDLGKVRKRSGDYDQEELEQAANKRALIGSIVEHWQRLADGRRTIVFPVGIRHSKAIVARFRAAGIAAEHLDGDTSQTKRKSILAALASGETPIVSSCGVLSEGVDIPAVKCVVMARPTQSLALVIQQAGRCMRPWNGVEPLILDHAGNVVRQAHGMPHADREWSLDSTRAPRESKHAAPLKYCAGCGRVVAIAIRECPSCQAAFDMPLAEPNETSDNLKVYRPEYTPEQKASEVEKLRAIAGARQLTEQWIARVYEAKFGESM